jgi:hypothetical protein
MTKAVAMLTDDGRSLRINPGKNGTPGSSEWIVTKRHDGWFTRHARNGGERKATGAEIVAAIAILDMMRTEAHSQGDG